MDDTNSTEKRSNEYPRSPNGQTERVRISRYCEAPSHLVCRKQCACSRLEDAHEHARAARERALGCGRACVLTTACGSAADLLQELNGFSTFHAAYSAVGLRYNTATRTDVTMLHVARRVRAAAPAGSADGRAAVHYAACNIHRGARTAPHAACSMHTVNGSLRRRRAERAARATPRRSTIPCATRTCNARAHQRGPMAARNEARGFGLRLKHMRHPRVSGSRFKV
jgi:hypothetical protein